MVQTRKRVLAPLTAAFALSVILSSAAGALSDRTKNTMGGAVIGAGVGYIVGGSKGATGGAVVGAIAGYHKKR